MKNITADQRDAIDNQIRERIFRSQTRRATIKDTRAGDH